MSERRAKRIRRTATSANAPAGGRRQLGAFTLIELLVVITIIVALVAVLLPAINAVIKKADVIKAKTETKSLVSAWRAYFNEYGCWPVSGNRLFDLVSDNNVRQSAGEEGADGNQSTGIVMVVTVMTNILYPSASLSDKNMNPICTNYNPKRAVFLSFRADSVNTKGDMVDPWGNPYKVMFDVNRDGKVDRPALGSFPATSVAGWVIAWSMGPDGVESTNDDVNSWQ